MATLGNHRDCHLFIKEENSFYYPRGTCSLTKLLRNKKPKINFQLFFHESFRFCPCFHFLGYKDFLDKMVVHIKF